MSYVSVHKKGCLALAWISFVIRISGDSTYYAILGVGMETTHNKTRKRPLLRSLHRVFISISICPQLLGCSFLSVRLTLTPVRALGTASLNDNPRSCHGIFLRLTEEVATKGLFPQVLKAQMEPRCGRCSMNM